MYRMKLGLLQFMPIILVYRKKLLITASFFLKMVAVLIIKFGGILVMYLFLPLDPVPIGQILWKVRSSFYPQHILDSEAYGGFSLKTYWLA